MKSTNPLLFLLLLAQLSATGQIYDDPKSIVTLLQELKVESRIENKIALLNRISFGYSLLFKTDSSIYYASKVLILAEENDLKSGVAQAYYNIGLSLQRIGTYAESVREFEIAGTFASQELNRKLIADIKYSIAHSYYMMRMYPSALREHLKTLNYLRRNRITEPLPMIYNSLGLIYLATENLDSSLYYFNNALQASLRYKQELFQLSAHKNIGRVYLRLGRETEGVDHLFESIRIADRSKVLHTRNTAVLSYECLAEYENSRGNYEKGVMYATKALRTAQEYHVVEDIYDVSGVLYQSYKGLGNTRKALEVLELHQQTFEQMHKRLEKTNQQALENGLLLTKQKMDITALQNEKKRKAQQEFWMILGLFISSTVVVWLFWLYRVLGKQKRQIYMNNLLLEQKVLDRTKDLEKAYNELEEAVMKGQSQERKRIAADIHDHLGGILSSVSIGVQLIDATRLSLKERQMFTRIKNQVRDAYDEIRLFSHNLSPKILEKEGLDTALNRMTQRLNLLHKLDVSLHICYTTTLAKKIEFNIYAIVTELINNILKHSGATKVSVSLLGNSDGGLLLEVEDDGIGFKRSQDMDGDTGIGLDNIQDRLDQINAKMNYSSVRGRTVFSMYIRPVGVNETP